MSIFELATALLILGSSGPEGARWVTVDVVNPETVGRHRILHLDDVVGPRRRSDIAGLPRAEAVLVFSVAPKDCAATGLCRQVAELTVDARARGALVLGVILATREQAESARADVRRAQHPFPVTFDVHGLTRRALVLDVPGVFVIMNGEGENISRTRASKGGDPASLARQLEQVRTTLLSALGKDEEDRR